MTNGWNLYQHVDTGDLVWARPKEDRPEMWLEYEDGKFIRMDQDLFDEHYEKVKGVE